MSGFPKIGENLGRFRLERRLGQSETGAVFLAADTTIGVEVALKIFSPALAEEEMFKRIAREVLVARRLNHPGLCRIHDLHEDAGWRFLTMDLVDGRPLEDLLGQVPGKPLAIVRAVRLVHSAAEAVAAAHQAEIVHRNLKPSNLVVGKDDEVVILDFGWARAPGMGGQTLIGAQQASLGYVAPELMLGREATALSDQYSLGAILYRCVTGRTPLETTGPVREDTGKRGAAPSRPGALNIQVAEGLEQVILTAIAANPQSRFRSVAELAEQLAQVEGEASVRARRPQRAAAGGQSGESAASATTTVRTTLLFSDIVGITAFFERSGDLAGKARIEQHNLLLFPVIRRRNGQVLKTIGDAIMASFDDEDLAIEAAIEMQQVLERHNAKLSDEKDAIHIRIGINSGETILEYGDAYGDAVNVASRVCAKAEGDQILVSEDTFRVLTRSRDIIQQHSKVVLKGKRDVFVLYQVDWPLADVPEPTVAPTPPAGPEKTLDEASDGTDPQAAAPDSLPPDLSADESDGEATSEATQIGREATEIVQAPAGKSEALTTMRRGVARDGLKSVAAPETVIDSAPRKLKLERNPRTTLAIVILIVLILLLLGGLLWRLWGKSSASPPESETAQVFPAARQ